MEARDALIENVVRVRRLAGEAPPPERDELLAIARDLESIVGPTIGRARAARLLGITQTALDRWLDRGAIASVITPRGRHELPLRPLIELLIDVRDARSGGARRPVSAVLGQRRRRADHAVRNIRVGADAHGHVRPEVLSLAYHQAVAQRLDEQLVSDARERVRRWAAAGTLDPRAAADWESILQLSIPEIASTLTSAHPGAVELRQNSPFAGVLDEYERRSIVDLAASTPA